MGRHKKIIVPIIIRSFEECYTEVSNIIESRKFKWHLDAIKGWYEWEDLKMHLLAHIYKKWELYDQKRPLKAWVGTVVNNQIINQLRNLYMSHAKPCVALKCPEYEGNDFCRKFGTCNCQCDLFCAWVKGKKKKHDIQLALPIENHMNEAHDIQSNTLDVEKTAEHLHVKMKEVLKPLEWLVYEMLYVKKLNEIDVAKRLKLKSSEGREPGYARINQIKKIILTKVKLVLKDGDIEMVGDTSI